MKFWFSIGVGEKTIKFNTLLLCSGIYSGDNPRVGLRNNLYPGYPRKGKSVYHLHIGGDPSYGFE